MLDVDAFSCSSEIHFSTGPCQQEMFSEHSGYVLSNMLENVTGKKEAFFFTLKQLDGLFSSNSKYSK